MHLVFFSDDIHCPGWKVVCRTEVKRRRIDKYVGGEDTDGLFALGRIGDHEGLQAQITILKEIEATLPTGRQLRKQDIFHPVMDDVNPFFDTNLGESSEDE